mgnify:CR=1 FL=1
MTFDNKKYAKEYREKPENKEKNKLYLQEYYKKNKEIINKKKRDFRKAHPEITKLWAKKTYEKNPKKAILRVNNWRKKEREKWLGQSREYYHNKADKNKIDARYKAKYYGTKKNLCERCGDKDRLQQHHQDYSKPLNTITLCKKCHDETHNKTPR